MGNIIPSIMIGLGFSKLNCSYVLYTIFGHSCSIVNSVIKTCLLTKQTWNVDAMSCHYMSHFLSMTNIPCQDTSL